MSGHSLWSISLMLIFKNVCEIYVSDGANLVPRAFPPFFFLGKSPGNEVGMEQGKASKNVIAAKVISRQVILGDLKNALKNKIK